MSLRTRTLKWLSSIPGIASIPGLSETLASLQTEVDVVEGGLANEVTRATAAEQALDSAVNDLQEDAAGKLSFNYSQSLDDAQLNQLWANMVPGGGYSAGAVSLGDNDLTVQNILAGASVSPGVITISSNIAGTVTLLPAQISTSAGSVSWSYLIGLPESLAEKANKPPGSLGSVLINDGSGHPINSTATIAVAASTASSTQVMRGDDNRMTAATESDINTGTDTVKRINCATLLTWFNNKWTAIKSAAATISGAWSFSDLTVSALKRDAASIVSVTNSRSLDNSDNGKRLIVSGSSDVALTLVSGLTSGFGCEIINALTYPAILIVSPSSTTINGSTRPVSVPLTASCALSYAASNAYRSAMSASDSPRAGRRDATSPNAYEEAQTWYAEDNMNNTAVNDVYGQVMIPGPLSWHRASGDYFSGVSLSVRTAASSNAVAEWQADIGAHTLDRRGGYLAFDLNFDVDHCEAMVGWSDQFLSGGFFAAFGIRNNASSMSGNFQWFYNSSGVVTALDSGIPYPASPVGPIRVIMYHSLLTGDATAEVWVIPTRNSGQINPIYLGSSSLSAANIGSLYNDRPFIRVKTLDSTVASLEIRKTTLKGSAFE